MARSPFSQAFAMIVYTMELPVAHCPFCYERRPRAELFKYAIRKYRGRGLLHHSIRTCSLCSGQRGPIDGPCCCELVPWVRISFKLCVKAYTNYYFWRPNVPSNRHLRPRDTLIFPRCRQCYCLHRHLAEATKDKDLPVASRDGSLRLLIPRPDPLLATCAWPVVAVM